MIYAVDFDGTLCVEKYPEIGEARCHRIQKVLDLQERGHKVILWTCRTDQQLTEAVEWCRERGLVFDAVNDNLPEIKEVWGGNTRKIYCDRYIDDKNLPAEVLDF
jgi:hypothetical protein